MDRVSAKFGEVVSNAFEAFDKAESAHRKAAIILMVINLMRRDLQKKEVRFPIKLLIPVRGKVEELEITSKEALDEFLKRTSQEVLAAAEKVSKGSKGAEFRMIVMRYILYTIAVELDVIKRWMPVVLDEVANG